METRRRFCSRLWPAVGWGSLATFVAGSAGATVGFFFPRVLYEPPSTFFAGKPDEYALDEVSARWTDTERVWIVRTAAGIYALQARCTHLGCTPGWFAEEALFKCPCHGSTFNLAGDVMAGPAPQPLVRLRVGLTAQGQLLVDRAVTENRPGPRERAPFVIRL